MSKIPEKRKAASVCLMCERWTGFSGCDAGHKPRYYLNGGGYKRVCDDFILDSSAPTKINGRWIQVREGK